jgi:hypothetical protein
MSNIKERATAWLESEEKDYQQGVSIVREISNSKGLINSLAAKESLQHKDKINYLISNYLNVKYVALTGVAKAGPAKVVEATEQDTSGTEGKTAGNIDDDEVFKSLPTDVQQLVTKKRTAFNDRNILSQKITDLTFELKEGDQVPAEVEGLTKEALEIDEQIKAYDSQLQYFYQNGKLPEMTATGTVVESKEEPITLERVEKLINNKKSQVSKAKKASDIAPDDLDKKTKLVKLEHELKDLVWQRDSLKQKEVIENQTKND